MTEEEIQEDIQRIINRVVEQEFYCRCSMLIQEVGNLAQLLDENTNLRFRATQCISEDLEQLYSEETRWGLESCREIKDRLDVLEDLLEEHPASSGELEDMAYYDELEEERDNLLVDLEDMSPPEDIHNYWIISDWLGSRPEWLSISEDYGCALPCIQVADLHIWIGRSTNLYEDPYIIEFARRFSERLRS